MRSKSRRPAREAALRALYQIEIGKSSVDIAVAEMRDVMAIDDDLKSYAETLVRGVSAKSPELQSLLQQKLEDWDFARLAAVDRTLLRIGAFELLHVEDVPPIVTLDEAVELAKKYSTAESGKFVNGILSAIWEASPKAGATSTPDSEEPAEPAPSELPVDEPELVQEGSPEWEEIAKTGAARPAPKEGEP